MSVSGCVYVPCLTLKFFDEYPSEMSVRLILKYIGVIVLSLVLNHVAMSNELATDTGNMAYSGGIDRQIKDFNAGEVILDHVADKHYWHILSWKGHDIELNLPVILFHEGRLYCFSSAKFHNPDHSYLNFQLRESEPHKGRIVALETLPDGTRGISATMPLDFSITKSVFGVMVSACVILVFFFFIVRNYKKRQGLAPTGIAALFEPVYLFVRDQVVYENMGKERGDRYLPYLASLFFFILFCNILGIVPFFPFGANTTGNISVSLTLALLTFLITMGSSTRHYWNHTLNTPGVPVWMKVPVPLMPVIEIIEILIKPFVLTVRLFANMTAGHIVLLGFMSLIFIFGNQMPALGWVVSPMSVALGIFADALEIFVSFVQAYVFTYLTSQYFASALGYDPSQTRDMEKRSGRKVRK